MLFAALQSNDFLLWNSWMLYLAQGAVIAVALQRRLQYVSDFFMPSLFVLAYSTANLVLGGYLVPRDFGWNKEFSTTVASIAHYRMIVPYLLGSNLVLYALTTRTLQHLPSHRAPASTGASPMWQSIAQALVAILLFLGVAQSGMDGAFSFELAIAVVIFTSLARRRVWYRFLVYTAFLGGLVTLSFQNKREIVMMLFLACFVETYFRAARVRLMPKNILMVGGASAVFFGLIMAASILRGYGDLNASSAVEAIEAVPTYMSSETFIDGITDNLELNYNYGVTVTAMDYGIRDLIGLQFGATLLKVLFLPIPRDFVSFKPDSMLQLFTKTYAPDWWAEEGSMPVGFAADMFVNFRFFGLIAFGLIMYAVNGLYVKYFSVASDSFIGSSCVFLVVTTLMFARGSGIEQWLFYFLLAAPVSLGICVLRASLRARVSEDLRWLV